VQQVLPSGRDFVDEARRLARVRHPHVLAVHGASYHDDRAGIWTDWIEGETLARSIERGDSMAPNDLLRVMCELAGAIESVHLAGLVHGDIKPSNVMLDARRGVVLMDFGAGFESSEEGVLMRAGTLRYLAPEVLAGQPANSAVDLYAFGVLAHFLACNAFPNEKEIDSAIRPRGLRALIAELLHMDAAQRPSAHALVRRLEALREAPLRRAKRLASAAAVTAIIAIALVSTLAYWRAERLRSEAEAARAQAEATTEFLHDLLGRAAPNALGPRASMRDLLDAAPQLIAQRFAGRAAERLRATMLLADLEADFNNDAAAARLSESAALTAAQIDPESDAAIKLSALALRRRALAGPALPALAQAAALLQKVQRERRPPALIAAVEYALAEVEFRSLLVQGNPALGERMLARLRRVLSPPVLLDARAEADALRRLSSVLIERGDIAQGIAIGERSVAHAEAHFGADHAITALNRRVLGWILIADGTGDGRRAEALFRRNLALHEAKLGRKSAAVADDLMGLSYVLANTDQKAEALSLAQEAWALINALYEPAARTTIDAGLTLANALKVNGQLAETEVLLSELRARMRQYRSSETRQFILLTRELAWLYRDQGKPVQSQAMYAECAGLSVRVLHPDNPIARECNVAAATKR
jgi:hypothetical protein